jgi:REP-associated tyrosine transposase
MRFDPDKHRHRSLRLKGYDCAEPGAYFVTICTRDRACLFGHVMNGEMHLNEAGEIAQRCWEEIPRHFPHTVLDAMIVMPNHIHGVIVITESCRGEASNVPLHVPKTTWRSDASPLRQRPNGTKPGSLSAIVQNFKSVTTKRINQMRGAPGTLLWQRNYYEHVVRNEAELMAIREYIQANPSLWDDDENNPAFVER